MEKLILTQLEELRNRADKTDQWKSVVADDLVQWKSMLIDELAHQLAPVVVGKERTDQTLADAGADLEHKLRTTKKGIKIIQNAKVLGGLEINIYVHAFENGSITTHPESFNVDVETQNKILDLLEEQYGKEYMRLKQEYWNL